MICLTVIIHATGTIWWAGILRKKFPEHNVNIKSSDIILVLSVSAVILMILLFAEVLVWAVLYFLLPKYTGFAVFEKALYFSLIAFTTVGYGDVILTGSWRIFAGIEAVNGVLLFWWSSASIYFIVQYIWIHTLARKCEHRRVS
jgi:hypothetical protein